MPQTSINNISVGYRFDGAESALVILNRVPSTWGYRRCREEHVHAATARHR
jgi:hypothetical protein